MSLPAAWPQVLNFFRTPLAIAPSSGQLSSEAGLLPIRRFDQRIGRTRAFADALDAPARPRQTLQQSANGSTRGEWTKSALSLGIDNRNDSNRLLARLNSHPG
jgi:hypothetical protein